MAVAAFATLGAALAYGFKRLVDLLGDELKAQRREGAGVLSGLDHKLDQHILGCNECRRLHESIGL